MRTGDVFERKGGYEIFLNKPTLYPTALLRICSGGVMQNASPRGELLQPGDWGTSAQKGFSVLIIVSAFVGPFAFATEIPHDRLIHSFLVSFSLGKCTSFDHFPF